MILTETIEIAVNVFQGLMLTYYAFSVNGSKGDVSYVKSKGLFYGIVLALLITIANYTVIFESFFAAAYVLLIFVYSYRELSGTKLFKAFVSIFALLVTALASAFSTNLFSYVLNVPLEHILASRSAERYVTMFFAQLFILYLLVLSMRILKQEFRNKNMMSGRELLLIILELVLSTVVCILLNMISLAYKEERRVQLVSVIVLFSMLVINIITCYLIIDINRKNNIARENELLKIKNEYNNRFVENASLQYETIRKIRHDYKNHIAAVNAILKEGKTDKVSQYLEDVSCKSDEMLVFIQTGNDIVNAVVNLKLSAAKALGIDCAYSSIADFAGIDDHDLCSLLSNMLDNAITAAAASEKKIMRINISANEWSYMFNVRNSIDSSVLADNPLLKTTKTSEGHGMGIRIIREIAEKYDGICDFYEEDDLFCCNVLLNIKE